MINELIKTLQLKDEKRSGQQLYNIEDPDSIAAHSWSVSLLTLIYGTKSDINLEKALKMAIVHDIPEIETGDIAKRANKENQEASDEEKEQNELNAILDISKNLRRNEIRQLWKDYNMKNTPEAKLVKDMDLIETSLTALKNQKEQNYNPEDNQDLPYNNLDEFFETCRGQFNTETGKKLFHEIEKKYQQSKNSEL